MKSIADIVNKNLVIKIPVWLLLTVLLFLYAVWEYYWYTKVGLSFIKWHTHLAGYIYLWTAGVLCYSIFSKRKPSEDAKNVFLLFSAVLFSLCLAELYLLLSGRYRTQTETSTGKYISPFIATDNTHYHIWPTTSKGHWITMPEYRVWRPTNSAGLPDYEWPQVKSDNKKRIMALGDSFVEGAGTAFDSSYVAFLRRKLNAAGDSFYIMNAGVCGSDPFYNYVLLRDRLLKYKPDIIIQTIESNDLNNDIILRGGMERFKGDGTQKFNNAPWWEPIYAVSYTSRIFFDFAGYNELLLKSDIAPDVAKKLDAAVAGLFRQYGDLCSKNNIKLAVVFLPVKFELKEQKYRYDFSVIQKQLQTDKRISVVDLMPAYTSYINNNHTTADAYYWVVDAHHNTRGYQMMADCIYEQLMPMLGDTTREGK